MEIVNTLVEEYAAKFTSTQSSLLDEIINYTQANHAHAHMLSGRVQGRLLALISKLVQPNAILEIGTFTGFSALCLAEGLTKNGILYTIELRNEDAELADNYFKKSVYSDKIKLLRGNAKAIIPSLNEEWDIVFIDADKTGYIDYYELTLPKLKKNGIIIADNVLFHGQVVEQEIVGKNAIAIDNFNKHINADERVEQVILSVRDGISIIRKK